jgi:hypothetical protein
VTLKLNEAQRAEVLKLVAAGKKSDAINEAGARFDPPFSVSRQQINKYRKSKKVSITEIRKKKEKSALNRGLALKEKRVEKLQKLAALLEKDFFGNKKRLWLKDKKGIGSGPMCKIFDFETFNAAEVAQYRGILDDIAREVGDRAAKIDAGDGAGLAVFQVIRAAGAKDAS